MYCWGQLASAARPAPRTEFSVGLHLTWRTTPGYARRGVQLGVVPGNGGAAKAQLAGWIHRRAVSLHYLHV